MKSRKRCPDCGGRLRLTHTNRCGKYVYKCDGCQYSLRVKFEVAEVEEKRGKWKRFERVEQEK